VQASGQRTGGKSTLADRGKYQFEADESDDEMEDQIDSNLDTLHGLAKQLNGLGRAMGEEVDTQNKHIDRIIGKTDNVDDQIARNRLKLDRIH
jgi:ABC-type transporter Mla subunit MlaD